MYCGTFTFYFDVLEINHTLYTIIAMIGNNFTVPYMDVKHNSSLK